LDLAKILGQLLGEPTINFCPPRSGEPYNSIGDPDKARYLWDFKQNIL
jgi:hypothetical protein